MLGRMCGDRDGVIDVNNATPLGVFVIAIESKGVEDKLRGSCVVVAWPSRYFIFHFFAF